MMIPVGKYWPEDTPGAAGSCNRQYRRKNSREGARPEPHAAANSQSLTLAPARAGFFSWPVRESVVPAQGATNSRAHSRVHEQHGKRTTRFCVDNAIESAKPLRPRGSSRRHGVIREKTRSAIMTRSVAFTASFSFALALLWSSAAASQGVADAE